MAGLAAGVAVVMVQVAPARAAVPWHEDMAAARTASAASRKPVFAVFTATWSPESTAFEQQALAAAEAEAVIAACFEPVRIDVDQRPGLTRRLQVAHVPSACVLGQGDTVLTRFDCPPTAAEFAAAVARAAQDAAAATAGATTAAGRPLAAAGASDATGLADSGFPTTAGDGGPLSEPASRQAPGRGSISLVTAKVRQLSDFATAPPGTAAAAPAFTAPTQEPPPSRFVSTTPVDPPALPGTPPAWPAETAASRPGFTNASPPPGAARGTIEPVPSTSAGGSWLAGAAPPAEPESSATASDLPATKKPASAWSSFVAAFQKPFDVFSKPVEPPTLPPARSTSPLTTAPETTATVAADTYGSMPLGLEGYCPVTLAERGVWTEGRAQWGVRHRGRTYLFAGPEQQQAFLASPDRYAPALSGDDPVVAFDQGRSLPGRRAYGVTYQSRMYLFSTPETRAQFAASPERYTGSVMLAERPSPVESTRRY